jgi:hypothetical protein
VKRTAIEERSWRLPDLARRLISVVGKDELTHIMDLFGMVEKILIDRGAP